jgi:hypothetical protein
MMISGCPWEQGTNGYWLGRFGELPIIHFDTDREELLKGTDSQMLSENGFTRAVVSEIWAAKPMPACTDSLYRALLICTLYSYHTTEELNSCSRGCMANKTNIYYMGIYSEKFP